MGTGSGRDVKHPPPSSAEVKERVELCLYSPSGPLWPILGRIDFYRQMFRKELLCIHSQGRYQTLCPWI